jgi:hypothetical protein
MIEEVKSTKYEVVITRDNGEVIRIGMYSDDNITISTSFSDIEPLERTAANVMTLKTKSFFKR